MKAIKITPERVTILGLILFIIILFFWKPCNKPGEQVDQLKTEKKHLEDRHKHDSIMYAVKISQWQDSIDKAAINSDLQVKVIKETEKKLQVSQSRISQLTAVIRNEIIRAPFSETTNLGDSSGSYVVVTRTYKHACDSLPNEVDKLNTHITELRQNNTDLQDLMNYEVILRDSVIEENKAYIDRLNNSFNTQGVLLNQALKAAKPRGRLLGGVGLIGNETNPLSGTKINLAYQSKGGKQYQVGGLLLRGAVYYEATVLITLLK